MGRKTTVGKKTYNVFRSPWGYEVLEYTKGKIIPKSLSKHYKSKSGATKRLKKIVKDARAKLKKK